MTTSWAQTLPQLHVVVDRARAQEIGLTVGDVADQAYYALKGGLTNEFYRLDNKRQFTILRPLPGRPAARPRPTSSRSRSWARRARSSRSARWRGSRSGAGPTLIEHDNFRRVVSVLGYYRKGGPPSMELSMDLLMAAHEKIDFPPGYGVELRGDMTQMEESFQRLLRGLYLAVIFMFLLLVAQFRSLIEPFNMIFSLSLMVTGILGGLLAGAPDLLHGLHPRRGDPDRHDDDGRRPHDRPRPAAARGGDGARRGDPARPPPSGSGRS